MKVLIAGASGSAGGSVLRACLDAWNVDEVRAIARKRLSIEHPKLKVTLHRDFLDLAPVTDLFVGLDAVLYCLGVSSTQVSGETEYRRITHDMAMAAARALSAGSPEAAFHFISGMSTDAGSKFMWARVKAETEQHLMDEVGAVCWRPAMIEGVRSDSAPWFVNAARPLGVVLRPFKSLSVKGEAVGRAMLRLTAERARRRIVENREIRELGDAST